VNLDVVGCCGETIAASTESGTMVDNVRAATGRLGVAFGRGGGSSDQTSFTRRNVPATLLDWTDNGAIHTTTDTIDKITPEHLRTIGRVAALVALEMAAGR
jgi:peptidase M28-like protein